MIEKKTVLVLGAGASVPYGFPTGRELLFEAVEKLRSTNPALRGAIQDLGIDRQKAFEFAGLLSQSMQPSVDAFVENNRGYMQLGKAAIALSLIPHEVEPLVTERRPDKMEWYEYLFSKIGPAVNDIENSKLTVVTFNYDRSLEYFWYRALFRSFGLDKEKTDRLYSRMPIIHLHGDLGLPDFLSTEGRPYLPSLASDSLRAAMDGIVIPGVVERQVIPQPEGL